MIKYMLTLTRGYRGRMAICTTAGILRVAAGLIFVGLCKRAVDLATGNTYGSIAGCIAGLVAVLAFELLCSAISSRLSDLSEAKMKSSLQEQLFSRLLTASWTGKEKFHSGDSLSRITEDCRVVSECLCKSVPTVLTALVQLIGAFLFLLYFSVPLAIILIVTLPLFLSAGKAFFRKIRNLTQQIRATESRVQEVMQESLYHRIFLLTCNQTARIIESISKLQRSRIKLIGRRTDFTLFSRSAVIAGFESGYLIAFLWGIRGLFMRTISFGTMTAYLQLAGQIQRPMAELARLLPGLAQSHSSFSRIAEIDGMQTESGPSQTFPTVSGERVGLSFKNVDFGYPDGEMIFNDFTHVFQPGSKTAITGKTGAGKSTLLLLALAVLKPQEGEIEVFTHTEAGKESEPVSSETRSHFVYVPQGNSLLSGTIRDNLRLGKPDATDEEMREALHYAAADFVFDLKSGLDTACGEHREGLSEGQAQRIAIARGLLQAGSILLLDEISGSLDEGTERQLMERLSSMRGSRTILLVTHRSATLDFCDEILTIGQVAE